MHYVKWKRSLFSLLCSFALVLSAYQVAYGAAPASAADTKDHWAEDQISEWMAHGWIVGYEDGSFMPDKPISRVELFALINRAFGFTETTQVDFPDLTVDDWKLTEIQKAVNAAYIHGYEDGTIRPDVEISRQEAAVILAQLLGLAPAEAGVAAFSDAANIGAWSMGAVGAVTERKLMVGYPDNTFGPAKFITRAEAVTALDQALQSYNRVYANAGTYGPETGTETIKGNIEIAVEGVTLRNMHIQGNLTFGAGIGDGDATLDNVKVDGDTIVQGGGENSIHLNNSVLLTIIVDKKDGAVRIVAEGSTIVAEVQVQTPVKLQGSSDEGGFNKVKLTALLPEGAKVTLEGSFESLEVLGGKIEIEIPSGSIGEITTSEAAEEVTLNLGEEANVVALVLNAVATLLGQGTIESATISEKALDGTTFEKEPQEKNGESTTEPEPAPSSTPPSSSNVAVSGVTLDADELTLVVGDTIQLTATISPVNATNKAIIWSSDNEDVATVDDKGNVTAIAPGVANITATSAANSSKFASSEVTVNAAEPEEGPSTYAFSFDDPGEITVGEEAAIAVTFATLAKGDFGYDQVQFQFSATGPGEVTFKATDTNNNEHTFTNIGVWGPAAGFAIPADYTATTDWKISFDQIGDYTIQFELVNRADGDAIIAQGSTIVQVVPVVTSLSMSADDVEIAVGIEFNMPVTVKGTVAEVDKAQKVRYYGIISGLDDADITLSAIPGGTPGIVTDETERGKIGAEAGDLVLAWGPGSGFPLGAIDYSGDGATTNFAATIDKAGTYTVTFVLYDLTAEKQLNAAGETADMTITTE